MTVKICILLLSAELWRMSGSAKYKGRWHRCVALPLLISWYFAWQCVTLKNGLFIFLSLFVGWQVFRIGYGIPDKDEGGIPIPEIDKKGSLLGRLCGTPELTRGIAGILYSLVGFIILLHPWIYVWENFTIGYLGSLLKVKAKFFERIIGAGVGYIIFLT